MDAHPLAGTIGNRFAYDKLVVIFRKVKGQVKPNVCDPILLSRHDRHGVMGILDKRCLTLPYICGLGVCCDDNGAVSALCVNLTVLEPFRYLGRCMLSRNV